MSKYKVGDKFIIELDYPYYDNWKIKGSAEVIFTDYILNKLKKYEEDVVSKTYKDGLNDAWELARKCASMRDKAMLGIFNTDNIYIIVATHTPQEALAKIEAYEKSQQIEIGDVIEYEEDNIQGVVIDIISDEGCYIYNENGCIEEHCFAELKKTGRHIDIEHLLEQIRGNE